MSGFNTPSVLPVFSTPQKYTLANTTEINTLKDNFLAPIIPCSTQISANIIVPNFPVSVTKPSRVPKTGNNSKIAPQSNSGRTIQTITPARRVKKVQNNSQTDKAKPAKDSELGFKAVTPAGRVKKVLTQEQLPRLITPARRVPKVPSQSNNLSKNTPLVQSRRQKFPSNNPAMSVVNKTMLSQSEKKPVKKSGIPCCAGRKDKDESQKKETSKTKDNQGIQVRREKDVKNKENEDVLKTPPTIHKVYVRPHTTRVISRSLFGGMCLGLFIYLRSFPVYTVIFKFI